MNLIRFGPPGSENPGVAMPDGSRLDTRAFGQDYDEDFFSSGGMARLAAWVEQHPNLPKVPDAARMGPPIMRPSKIVCVGLNYADHARESGLRPPDEPVLFFKASSAVCGPYDDVVLPGEKTDWEVELAVVISQRASRVTRQSAPNHIAGYLVHNDYSERAFQIERGGQWVKGKSADTFAPLGPFLVPRDAVSNPNNLRLWLSVNGRIMQDGSTSNFIFGVHFIISYISQFMTLLPGDVVSTGTPAGVGLGLKPPRYLQPGDIVELGIEGLGNQRQIARAQYLSTTL